jgi:hypothetical protein
MRFKEQIIDAAISRLEAEKKVASVNLNIMLENNVGVAEHVKIVEEVIQLTSIIADIDDRVNILKSLR